MSNLPKLNRLLKNQCPVSQEIDIRNLLNYAESILKYENVIAVVSDLRNSTSRIFTGKLGLVLGISDYYSENSIWEKAILDLMTEEEREEKYLAEIRFFNFLRHISRHLRQDYYMVSKLCMKTLRGDRLNVIHRMFYVYDADSDVVTHALCLYGVTPFEFAGKSIVVNSITGVSEELTSAGGASILSKREQQVLKLIDGGKTSTEIAGILSISRNTVSRHRQEILAKLQVKNSVEACRIAKTMGIV